MIKAEKQKKNGKDVIKVTKATKPKTLEERVTDLEKEIALLKNGAK